MKLALIYKNYLGERISVLDYLDAAYGK